MGRSELVNDLAARLDRALESDLLGRLPAARRPAPPRSRRPRTRPRSAYTYPGGKLDRHRRRPSPGARRPAAARECTLTAPPDPGQQAHGRRCSREANQHGLVTPPVVVGLLTAAALDPQRGHRSRATPPSPGTTPPACAVRDSSAGDFDRLRDHRGRARQLHRRGRRQADGAGAEHYRDCRRGRLRPPPAPASSTAAPAARDRADPAADGPVADRRRCRRPAIQRADRRRVGRYARPGVSQTPSRVRRWRGGGRAVGEHRVVPVAHRHRRPGGRRRSRPPRV